MDKFRFTDEDIEIGAQALHAAQSSDPWNGYDMDEQEVQAMQANAKADVEAVLEVLGGEYA